MEKKILNLAVIGLMMMMVSACKQQQRVYTHYDEYPVRKGDLMEVKYTPGSTTFTLWAPTADEVVLRLYDEGQGGHAYEYKNLSLRSDGTWFGIVLKDLLNKFYTFDVRIGDKWLGETAGINARAVGVNGERGAIVNMRLTDPIGWENDVRPELLSPADMIIYELHYRDISMHESSGMTHKGKYLALTEKGTRIPGTYYSTGIDHLQELGITHVHLLPSFDYASIDETLLSEEKYNWGYDPKNYNVPEGSYSTDPYDPYSRITEFKQMVRELHRAGIRVVLDVVYNHTYFTENSAFERTVPGYFYRHHADSTFSNASGCGNEVASERAMMRKYMIESVLYWINEYHIDGFRFDLMGIHDIETMNQIRKAIDEIDPTICIYGEGWAAMTPQYPGEKLAMKGNASQMPGIAVFSDELRDALRGHVMNDTLGGFLAGVSGQEESLKFGIVGAINHPQIDYSQVNYTDTAWAVQPTQMISYVSCHDDLCLVDRLKSTIPGITTEKLLRLNKMAQTAVFTSQGIPFLFAGEEILRNKRGIHNSYQSSDLVNAIDWKGKDVFHDLYSYYRDLIRMRRNHPAFRMGDADLIREHLEFLSVEQENVVAFQIKGCVENDTWEDIVVIFNASEHPAHVSIPEGSYTVVCFEGEINEFGLHSIDGPDVFVPMQSAMIMHK